MLDIHSQLCYNNSINKGETISSLFINNCSSLFNMNQVLIHCKPRYLDEVIDLGLSYIHSSNDEIDVTVSDIDYDPDHYLVDPDEQLCDHYGIDYDQVNCIELV